SGGDGGNTVDFVGTPEPAGPAGVGLPPAPAPPPSGPPPYAQAGVQTHSLVPPHHCALNGLPPAPPAHTSFPFGLWFANATTVYIADEGDGDNTFAGGTYTKAAASKTAGLQKWVLVSGKWTRTYTLQAGLNLGVPYTIANYSTGNNPATK